MNPIKEIIDLYTGHYTIKEFNRQIRLIDEIYESNCELNYQVYLDIRANGKLPLISQEQDLHYYKFRRENIKLLKEHRDDTFWHGKVKPSLGTGLAILGFYMTGNVWLPLTILGMTESYRLGLHHTICEERNKFKRNLDNLLAGLKILATDHNFRKSAGALMGRAGYELEKEIEAEQFEELEEFLDDLEDEEFNF